MFKRIMDQYPIQALAGMLSLLVLLATPLSTPPIMGPLLGVAGPEFNNLFSQLAMLAMLLLTIVGVVLFFTPMTLTGRLTYGHLIFLVIAAFAGWRLWVMSRLIKTFTGS